MVTKAAVVLAAGQGTRMRSRVPKVLHRVCGKPMVSHVVDAAEGAGVDRTVVVVAKEFTAVQDEIANRAEYAVQGEQLGSGHALLQARTLLESMDLVAVLSGALHLVLPEAVPTPGFMLLSGGLLLAAVFMVTDPVSTPTTAKGAWIFGLGVGGLVVLIRAWGGLPEGVMYAILLMNAATPHIERYTQPRPFGGG